MDRRDFLRSAAIAAVSLAGTTNAQQRAVTDASAQLEAIRGEHGLPGIAAAAVRGDRIVAEGVAGVRRVGQNDRIAPDDRFAMASCTKRMTAAMVARVVDSGEIAFETKLAEALPNFPMRDDYRSVTVAQLLLFSGGIQPYLQFGPMEAALLRSLKGTPREQREQFIKHVLQEEPIVKPGTQRYYSNASYALVAFVAEQRTGKSWEDLMQAEVFQPLGMTTAGFGRPHSSERPNEPTLHSKTDTGFEPEPGDRVNVMAAFAPAGDVHCSVRDFAKFAIYELGAARGHDSLLSPATAKRWKEISQTTAPLISGKGKKTKGGPNKGEGGKRPPNPADGRSFFGGSAYVSAGFILWPDENLAAVAAVNAGSSNEAVREAFEAVKSKAASG